MESIMTMANYDRLVDVDETYTCPDCHKEHNVYTDLSAVDDDNAVVCVDCLCNYDL